MYFDIGFGNLLNAKRVVSILNPESAPVKRLVVKARVEGCVVDATCRRACKAVIYTDNGQIYLSYLRPKTLATKAGTEGQEESGYEE